MRRALLVNVGAAGGRWAAEARSLETRGAGVEVFVTRSAHELDEVARSLRSAGVGTLAVAGGDGTLHAVTTALVRTYEGAPLPTILPLGGGTVNSITSSLGVTRRSAMRGLRRLCTGTEDRLRVAARATLVVDGRVGSLFGVGVLPAYLAAYYGTGRPSVFTAAQVLGRTVVTAMRGVDEGLLARARFRVRTAEGEDLGAPPTLAVAAGTVRFLGLRFALFPRAETTTERMHLVRVHGSPRALVGQLAAIRLGRPMAPEVAVDRLTRGFTVAQDAPRLRYMIDGELYDHEAGELRVEVGPTVRYLLST